jgi:hypothetical protein
MNTPWLNEILLCKLVDQFMTYFRYDNWYIAPKKNDSATHYIVTSILDASWKDK